MDLSLPSRRNVLKAGAAVAGAGVVGGCVLNRSDLQGDDTPGAKGLTAGTVPGDINRLIQIDADVAFRDGAIERGTNALLNSAAFAEVPDTIAMTFDGESATGIDRRGVGKLVIVGSDDANGGVGAIVWADWNAGDLPARLGWDDVNPETRQYANHTLYTVGEVTATAVSDVVFAVGTSDVTRAIIDVWHHDGDPLMGDLLGTFERSSVEDPTRFALVHPNDVDVSTGPAPDSGDRTTFSYGAVFAEKTDRVAEVNVTAHDVDLAKTLVDELATSLLDRTAAEKNKSGTESAVPVEIAEDIDIVQDADAAVVRYRAPADQYVEFVEAVGRELGL